MRIGDHRGFLRRLGSAGAPRPGPGGALSAGSAGARSAAPRLPVRRRLPRWRRRIRAGRDDRRLDLPGFLRPALALARSPELVAVAPGRRDRAGGRRGDRIPPPLARSTRLGHRQRAGSGPRLGPGQGRRTAGRCPPPVSSGRIDWGGSLLAAQRIRELFVLVELGFLEPGDPVDVDYTRQFSGAVSVNWHHRRFPVYPVASFATASPLVDGSPQYAEWAVGLGSTLGARAGLWALYSHGLNTGSPGRGLTAAVSYRI